MAAEGLIPFDELRSKLAALDEVRETARRELTALEDRQEMLADLERDRNALLECYAAMVPEVLDDLTGEERRTVYRMLRLQVVPTLEGLELSGVFRLNEPTPTAGIDANGRL
jgi:DNA repair exonuclease SbcCD ATPase subunit